MHDEQEHELIMGVLLRLYLFKHGLSFLQQDESFFVRLLGDKVDRRLYQFINNDGYLV